MLLHQATVGGPFGGIPGTARRPPHRGGCHPAGGPNPVHLSYHIVGANTGTVYVWDGTRGVLPNDVPPSTQAVVPMRVESPAG